ncbi:MAG: spondin domain-containing protein [Paracoccaceae bacterium]
MKFLSTVIIAASLAAPAMATTLRVTVTNNQAAPTAGVAGFALTPVYSAFHNGLFDSYNLGEEVSAGVEQLAEVGNPGLLPDERTALGVSPGSTAITVANGRPIFGGETAYGDVVIDDFANQRFFSFLSMVVPTNDTFIANGNPTLFDLFNDDGTFAGPLTINVTGLQVRDAGTEANDASASGGAAFGANSVGGEGVDTRGSGGVTEGFTGLSTFLGTDTVPGFQIDPALGGSGFFDDINNAALFNVATITIEISPVPLPAGGVLLLSAMGFAGFVSRRKARAAKATA